MGHIFGSGIFVYLTFIQYSHVSFFCFFIWVALFIIYHVDIIVFKGYPGWLFLQTCGPSVGCSSLVWEDSPDLHSVGFSRCCCCCIHSYVCRTSLRCGAVSLSHCVSHIFCLCLGDLLSLPSLSDSSVISMISLSISGSNCSNVLGQSG